MGLPSVWLVSSGFSSIVPTRMLSSLGHIRLVVPLVVHHVIMVTCKERTEIDDGNLLSEKGISSLTFDVPTHQSLYNRSPSQAVFEYSNLGSNFCSQTL